MWNVNYQGLVYGEEHIRENKTMIYAQVMTSYDSISVPAADFDRLYEEWSKIAQLSVDFSGLFYWKRMSCDAI